MQGRNRFKQFAWVTAVVFLCAPTVWSGDGQATSTPSRTDHSHSVSQKSAIPLGSNRAEDVPSSRVDQPSHTTVPLRGRVVWMAEALKRRYNVETDTDASAWLVALETDKGELHPLINDVRGRAFRADERLRDVGMELVVRRYAGSPMLQVIRVYTLKEDDRYEVDYWCDICAIPMFELKQCECCQGPTRIRERKVDPASGATTGEEPPEDRRLDSPD